jgi:hypothetical protein
LGRSSFLIGLGPISQPNEWVPSGWDDLLGTQPIGSQNTAYPLRVFHYVLQPNPTSILRSSRFRHYYCLYRKYYYPRPISRPVLRPGVFQTYICVTFREYFIVFCNQAVRVFYETRIFPSYTDIPSCTIIRRSFISRIELTTRTNTLTAKYKFD